MMDSKERAAFVIKIYEKLEIFFVRLRGIAPPHFVEAWLLSHQL